MELITKGYVSFDLAIIDNAEPGTFVPAPVATILFKDNEIIRIDFSEHGLMQRDPITSRVKYELQKLDKYHVEHLYQPVGYLKVTYPVGDNDSSFLYIKPNYFQRQKLWWMNKQFKIQKNTYLGTVSTVIGTVLALAGAIYGLYHFFTSK